MHEETRKKNMPMDFKIILIHDISYLKLINYLNIFILD